MENQVQVVEAQAPAHVSLFSRSPAETVKYATEIANALKPVIDGQKMFAIISGKKYPTVEAWLTLGALLGVTPREVSVAELADGSYEAKVELVNTAGRIVGGASALCGIEERRWDKAERFARRSMAITRATGKAYRLAFAWLIQLAGYQPTPAEEMPHDPGFNPDIPAHADAMEKALERRGVPKEKWTDVASKMKGRSSDELDVILKESLS